ncbi:MAG: hypothetical protein ABIP29_11370, partial [Candidatus Eisenbacteria bacterium]
YLPLWLERGAAAVTWYDHGYPSPGLVLKKATVDLWGWPGFLAWGAIVAAALIRATGRRARPDAAPGRTTAGRVVDGTAAASLGAWLRLPYKATYLVPAVPFLLLAHARHLWPAALRALLLALLVSPWILSIYAPAADDAPSPWARRVDVLGRALVVDARGPVLLDHAERQAHLAYIDRVVRAARHLPPGSAVVVQDWVPHLRLALGRVRGRLESGGVLYTHLLDREAVARLRAEGRILYYLPGTELANRDRYGVDLVAAGARPLVP